MTDLWMGTLKHRWVGREGHDVTLMVREGKMKESSSLLHNNIKQWRKQN